MWVVVFTTTTALLLAGGATLLRDLDRYRTSQSAELLTEADILSLATAPALAFDDRETATRILTGLRTRPAVLAAALYDTQGSLFAQYARGNGAILLAERVGPPGLRVIANRIELTKTIADKGEWLGTIYLVSAYDVSGALRDYARILALVAVLSLAVALVLSTLLQRALTAPLDAMANVARQVIGQRDYSLRASKTTQDEVGVVVEAFNSMLGEVQDRTRALEATNSALAESDKRKDIFIATLAHELRNPLAPLRIAGRLLASPALTPAQLEETRAIIGRQTSHMALLLDDLLDASRITRGALQLKKDVVDLADCVAAAVEAAKPLFDRKRHRLSVLAAAEPIVLEADPVRLTQIITNLLTNAGKYTDPGGEISLRTQVQDRFALVSVRDSGIGLAPEAIPKLFEMFSQVQGAGTRSEGGLGIGLALAKGLVTLHGGRIEAHSEGLGRGSEFRVYLPRTVRASGAPEGNPDDGEVKSASTRRVLVVDDNRDAADGLALFLRIAGHEVAVAYNASDALSVADRTQPQLLLLDIGMPGMNGYELARRIRDRPWSAHSVLVAITGWGQEEDKRRAGQAGFDQHMTKPIDPAAIQTLLHDLDRG
jgi:signal transduction histidine kinase